MLKRVLKIAGVVLLVLIVLLTGAVAAVLWTRAQGRQANEAIGRIVSPNGIAVSEYVKLGGVRQWITIRGQDRNQPILLFLHGGPGGVTSDVAFSFQRPWEDYFTVVQWDQRAFGRSAVDRQALKGTVTKEQLVADTIELIDYLRRKLNQPKVVLVGHSWGTILGATVAARRPDLLYAYVGIEQVVSWEAGFVETQRQLLELADRTGDKALATAMRNAGAPPRGSDVKAHLEWVGKIQGPAGAHGGAWHNLQDGDFIPVSLVMMATSPSLTLSDLRTLLSPPPPEEFYFPLVRTVLDWDFREHVGVDFKTPVIFIGGRHDLASPLNLVTALEQEICAPYKSLVVFEHSAHMPMFEEPGRLVGTFVTEVLPLVEGKTTQTSVTCTKN